MKRAMKRVMSSGVLGFLFLFAIVQVGLTAGCVGWEPANFKAERTSTAAAAEPMPVRILSDNGAISLAPSTDGQVEIVAKIKATTQERLDQVVINAAKDTSGVFVISATWPPPGRRGSEGVEFAVKIPATTGIELKTSNGAIRLDALAGAAKLQTSNGAVTVVKHDGSINANTSNGAISIDDANAPVIADTSNGSITVSCAATFAGPVNADSSNGAIKVKFGEAFAGSITADTSNGRVTITDPAAGTTLASGKGPVVWVRGSGDKSVLDTSNGSVTVEVPGGAKAKPAGAGPA